jgi:hypothetical protein
MAYKIFENTFAVLNNPGLVKKSFVAALKSEYGVDYSIAKTVAVYIDPYNATVVNLPVVNIMNAVSYPENEHFLILGIRALQGAGAALGSIAWTAGITDAIAQNGNFNLNNSGTTEIKNMPLTAFQPGSNYPDSGLLLLEKPIFWKAQTQITTQLTFPTVPATANLAIRFEVMGIKLI